MTGQPHCRGKKSDPDTMSNAENATDPVHASFDYQRFADALEEVTYWHLAWYSQAMAVLVLDEQMPALNPHDCKFGRFMDATVPPPGRETEFKEIANLHHKMHERARILLCDRESDGRVSKEAFDELSEIQTLFVGACNALLRAALLDGVATTTRD